jgi:transcriptional regulator with XRE-family HTH domain
MAGLGEARREYHRSAVAEKVRELRGMRGWSQEKLAEKLGIDRRQVVRLESRRAPVTLEVVEALAQAFGEVSFVFMWSAMNRKEGKPIDRDLRLRLAEQEALSRMNANLNRPVLTWIVATAATLPDEDLDLLAQTALAIFRARAATDSDPGAYVPLRPQLARERGLEAPRRRVRESNPQVR